MGGEDGARLSEAGIPQQFTHDRLLAYRLGSQPRVIRKAKGFCQLMGKDDGWLAIGDDARKGEALDQWQDSCNVVDVAVDLQHRSDGGWVAQRPAGVFEDREIDSQTLCSPAPSLEVVLIRREQQQYVNGRAQSGLPNCMPSRFQ